MSRILILSNDSSYTYNFRREIITELINEGNQVINILISILEKNNNTTH